MDGSGHQAAIDETVAGWRDRYGGASVDLGDLLCDAHPADAVAVLYEDGSGVSEHTFGELGESSKRLAGALRDAGVEPGDRVAVMLPKSPELVIALLAIWRAGAVHVPLFTAFGPDAAAYRIAHSGARLVIADAANRDKVQLDGIPVICHGGRSAATDRDFAQAIESGVPHAGTPRAGHELMFMLFTSGTTGQPKGVEVPVCALASFHSYMHFGLDLRPSDRFWNMADPGWAYGLWYAMVGPLASGQTTFLRNLPFDAEGVFAAIREHRVTNLAAAPTVFRALRAAGVSRQLLEGNDLRAVSSAGEPLNPELLEWSSEQLGAAIHDHYGQSELGMVVAFPHQPALHRRPLPGSMGISLPGFRTVVLDADGNEVGPGVDGELAIDTEHSPLFWFRGYYEEPERTAERFRHGPKYYLSADAARLGEDGLVSFASRADDVITSSGYRIGPFEVENALIAHEAIAEVAVVGTPDDLRGEAVTAFVVVAPRVEPSAALAEQLQEFVKARLAKHLYPRQVEFVEALPRTPSGKVQRNLLRERWASRVG